MSSNTSDEPTESVKDTTAYAPAFLEDAEAGPDEEPAGPPVGRYRLAVEEVTPDHSIEIPHEAGEHIFVAGSPRSGKDSALVSIGKALKDVHGYSYFSILDDGRMETPLLATPTSDPDMEEALAKFDQQPAGMNVDVFVPSTDSLPDELPGNFRPFTIGIDSLSTSLLLRLGGVEDADLSLDSTVTDTRDQAVSGSGDPEDLISGLESAAERQVENQDPLSSIADRLRTLVDAGVVASTSAETNVDMAEVIENQERGAVLCCNFLEQDQEALKYTITDLWLRLIYQARDEDFSLPRVCLEIRGLDNLAPARLSDVAYPGEVQWVRETIYLLSVQGGSRRVLMLGSASNPSGVHQPVRSNMATKIVLRLGGSEVELLDKTFSFTSQQKKQIQNYDRGTGMLIIGGDCYSPIQFRPAPCGWGAPGEPWLDEYGRAAGARVLSTESDTELSSQWWVDLADCQVNRATDVTAPVPGQWYLTAADFPDEIDPADVDEALIDEVLEERRHESVQSDLLLTRR